MHSFYRALPLLACASLRPHAGRSPHIGLGLGLGLPHEATQRQLAGEVLEE